MLLFLVSPQNTVIQYEIPSLTCTNSLVSGVNELHFPEELTESFGFLADCTDDLKRRRLCCRGVAK